MSAPVIDRATWLRMKREPMVTLGSSSAAAACGMSSKRSTFVLYHEIRGDLPTEDLSDNRFVYYGNLFESVILRDCARKLGLRLLDTTTERDEIEALIGADGGAEVVAWVQDEDGRSQPFVRSVARPWQVATLDGCAIHIESGAFVIAEVKNQDSHRSVEWSTDESAPDDYWFQGLHQLSVVTSAAWCVLYAVIGGNTPRWVIIGREPAHIDNLNLVESDFMGCVESGREPDADGSDLARSVLVRLHPDDNGRTTTLPFESCEKHAELVELEAQAKPLRARLKAIDAEIESRESWLRQRIGDFTFGLIPNGAGKYSLRTQNTTGGGTTRVLRFVTPNRRK